MRIRSSSAIGRFYLVVDNPEIKSAQNGPIAKALKVPYIRETGGELQDPLSVLPGTNQFVHGFECSRAIVESLDMKRVAALVKRLPDLTGAFHRFIENGPVPRRDLLEVFTCAPRTT